MKSYQIVEPPFLDRLISTKAPLSLQMETLNYVVCKLREMIKVKNLPIEVDVIEVKYISEYPAIGIHYLNSETPDYGEFVEEQSEKIIKTFPLN